MKKKLSFPALLGTAVLVGSFAQNATAIENDDLRFDTTADLFHVCSVTASEPEYPVANQACRAFIEAAVQYHDAVSDRKGLPRLVCYPKDATIQDGKDAFVAWSEKNAGNKKLMDEQPVIGLVRSLAGKYPCS
ncbi:MAG: hypothetical protein LJE70_07770 [Chromatiaceae bacterium]|jgi:hypothetical protein|nr:hypothetical protein [Chromatiaceae bacterium]